MQHQWLLPRGRRDIHSFAHQQHPSTLTSSFHQVLLEFPSDSPLCYTLIFPFFCLLSVVYLRPMEQEWLLNYCSVTFKPPRINVKPTGTQNSGTPPKVTHGNREFDMLSPARQRYSPARALRFLSSALNAATDSGEAGTPELWKAAIFTSGTSFQPSVPTAGVTENIKCRGRLWILDVNAQPYLVLTSSISEIIKITINQIHIDFHLCVKTDFSKTVSNCWPFFPKYFWYTIT